MLRPKLRALESSSVQHRGEPMLMLRDPYGLTEQVALLPRLAVHVLSLCDGERTVSEVASEFEARTGRPIDPARITDLLAQLDAALLLDSPRFAAHRRELETDFRRTPLRAAAHAGGSYPDRAAALTRYLDDQAVRDTGPGKRIKRAGRGPGAGAASSASAVRALISPHIDMHRGGGAYAHAFRPLLEAPASARPDVVVVFGTDHHGEHEPFTLTRKSYDTPLGAVPTDVASVDRLAAALGPGLFAEELHHRREHSIEFQAVWLRHVYGADCPPMLPILCGSLHELIARGADPTQEPALERFIGALRDTLHGRRVLVIAGADLAHVGPAFGDPHGLGSRERSALVRSDANALAAAARGDSRGFFASIAAVGDRNRVCGLAPIYATLRLCEADADPLRGQQVAYDQCAADDAQKSFVSIASMVYR